ncbi:hypothetical protein SLA2020_132730 [Shorea laevis]
MQSTFYCTYSSSVKFSPSWRTQKGSFSKTQKLRFKTLTLSNSLRTRIDYKPEEDFDDGIGPIKPAWLPVVIRKSGKVSRYFWDGNCVQLVSVDGGTSSLNLDFSDGFQELFRVSSLVFRNFFIPKQVRENYIGYVKWKFLHRVFSSALQVLATQAIFRAIGIGYTRSLAGAAALKWVLKEGLGRLSRGIYTASAASTFDTNLKRVRFSTSILFSLSIGVELLTPIFPQYFLLLASIANIAKHISLSSYLGTSSAIHRSFAIADNLGEVSAKAQVQSLCFDNLGLMLAVALNMLLQSNQRLQAVLPFVIYPLFSAVDLFGIYQGLKHVHLQTLTKDRVEIILNRWIEMGYVPSPEEVSKDKEIDFMWSKGKEMWPIRIGCLNPKGQISKSLLMAMQSVSEKDRYFICIEMIYKGFKRTRKQGILLFLHEEAQTADVIMGLLQACYVRKALLSSSRWESMLKTSDFSNCIFKEWFNLIEDSRQWAQQEFFLLNEQMSALGWTTRNILLNAAEQARYSFSYKQPTSTEDLGATKPSLLPLVIHKSGKVSSYFWDGNHLHLESDECGASSFNLDFNDGFQELVRVSSLAVKNLFIPKQVSENYIGYVKWKFVHRIFSSALQVLATQSMIRAIGVGYSHSLPSAAALNWVLKEGLGRLSRFIFTSSMAFSFDTNLKRVRFSTSVLFSLCIGVELLTPTFPQYFLLLASLANVAKQISLACYWATNSPIHRSFAIADNLGEVSAKAQIQSVCFDTLGLALSVALNMLLQSNQRFQAILPFIIYPLFSAIDLFGAYQGLKHVHLQTLTKDRVEIILNRWMEMGYVPSPEEVSKEEEISFMWSKGKKLWPIRIGCVNRKDQISRLLEMTLQSVGDKDQYLICVEMIHEGFTTTGEQGILLFLREGAQTADVIMGLLQACYVRKALLSSRRWESLFKTSDQSELIFNEWFKLIEDSRQWAQREFYPLNEQMSARGWAVRNILLNAEEQIRYSHVDD